MFSLNCARINSCVNSREVGDLSRYRTHYDGIVVIIECNLNGADDMDDILGLLQPNERRPYKVTPSLIGWVQTWNQPWNQYFHSIFDDAIAFVDSFPEIENYDKQGKFKKQSKFEANTYVC